MEGGRVKSEADHDSPTLGPSPVSISEGEAVGWPVQNWDRYQYEAYIAMVLAIKGMVLDRQEIRILPLLHYYKLRKSISF
jgi:hypothetical protein